MDSVTQMEAEFRAALDLSTKQLFSYQDIQVSKTVLSVIFLITFNSIAGGRWTKSTPSMGGLARRCPFLLEALQSFRMFFN